MAFILLVNLGITYAEAAGTPENVEEHKCFHQRQKVLGVWSMVPKRHLQQLARMPLHLHPGDAVVGNHYLVAQASPLTWLHEVASQRRGIIPQDTECLCHYLPLGHRHGR